MRAPSSPVQATDIGSAEHTVEVLRLYGEMAELVKTEHYKVLQAAAQHMQNEQAVALAKKLTDSDDEEEEADSDDEAEAQEIDIDFKGQLASIRKMDKDELKKHVQQADKGFSEQFRNLAMQVGELFPQDGFQSSFSARLLDDINAKLSDADKRIAISPISLQLDTGAATNDELSRFAITWALSQMLQENEHEFEQALEPLKRLYLADSVYRNLKSALKEGEIPELHEDLRLGDLAMSATDVIVLPFKQQVENDSSVASSWAVRKQKDVVEKLRLTEYRRAEYMRTRSDDDVNIICIEPSEFFFRRNILDKSSAGDFSSKVVSMLLPIVKDSTTELVYNCWAFMLSDLVSKVTRCVSDAREVINPRAAGRLIVKSESHARSDTRSLADD